MRTSALLRQVSSDWRNVDPTLDARPMLQVLTLTRLGAQVQARLNDYLHREGLNAAGWDLLLTLYRSAPAPGLHPAQLADRCAVNGPAISNRIARLEARGLIIRDVTPQDRRAARVRLSDAGRAAVERLLPAFLALETELLSTLDETERTVLTTLGARLLDSLEARAPAQGAATAVGGDSQAAGRV